MVKDVTGFGEELVAVGVSYDRPLGVFGPTPPHEGRVWTSRDGRAWQPVEFAGEFENFDPAHLVVRADGSLLLLGTRGFVDENGYIGTTEPAALVSMDARHWTTADSGLPTLPSQVVQGRRGYLAYISSLAMAGRERLFHSLDAVSWEPVDTYPDGNLSVGAGPQGFVVAATVAVGSDPHQYVVRASENGQDWVESRDLPPVSFPDVVSLGRDWVLLNDDDRDELRGRTWFSANGLDWSELGRIPLGMAETPDGLACGEYIRDQFAAGPWLIVASELSYPCSESGYEVHGTQFISIDGAAWEPIPIAPGVPGESRSGSTLHAAVTVGSSLVVAGEQNGAATFWIAEPR